MSCDKCVRKTYCQYLYHFNMNEKTGCVEFQDREYVNTIATNTLNTKEELE